MKNEWQEITLNLRS